MACDFRNIRDYWEPKQNSFNTNELYFSNKLPQNRSKNPYVKCETMKSREKGRKKICMMFNLVMKFLYENKIMIPKREYWESGPIKE